MTEPVPQRDVAAIARASGYEKHGTTFLGGSFAACICPKKPCGGVAGDDEQAHCPEHRRTPAQLWHWAAECPEGTAPLTPPDRHVGEAGGRPLRQTRGSAIA